jgi:DNA polymerase-3 subunit delta'
VTAPPLPWQAEAWARVSSSADAGRLAPALLLAGPRGAGKRAFAAQLTAYLLCEAAQKPCGRCRGCVQLKAGSHPDAWLLEPQGLYGLAWNPLLRNAEGLAHWVPEDVRKDPDKVKRDIAIDGVRELLDRVHLSSHYGARKIAVCAPADALNASSVNALLKTVEEPPAATHFVLIAERWRALPATLRSRCQILRFAPRGPRDAVAADVELEAEWGRALADVRQGRLQALAIAQNLKRDDAQRALEAVLRIGAAWLRQQLAPAAAGSLPAAPKGAGTDAVQGLLDEALAGLEALGKQNASPALLVESIMIRWASSNDRG